MWSALLCVLAPASALPLLKSPPMGWSTWNSFGCNISESLIHDSILALDSSTLKASGYNYILIDDCWTTCQKLSSGGGCEVPDPNPRDSSGRIKINAQKFPNGFLPLTSLAHSKNLKIGIYTSVSATTCAGFTGSFQHEAVDAQAFVDWGFDFVKHDTCGTDYSVHDGGLQNASIRMREGLWDAGKGTIVYYIDNGNPTSPQRIFNPFQRWVKDKDALLKMATVPSELVWVWATQFTDGKGPHIFKSWYDIFDDWSSTLDNVHNQIRIAEYQRNGLFNTPDMLTVGMGAQTQGQYRAQFFLWCILGAPLILGNDIRKTDQWSLDLLTAPEVIAVDQDTDCIQGSLAKANDATELWIKPLSDNTFAAVLLNKGRSPANVTVDLDNDFDPADFDYMHVRDLFLKKDLGSFHNKFTMEVPALDAAILKLSPYAPV